MSLGVPVVDHVVVDAAQPCVARVELVAEDDPHAHVRTKESSSQRQYLVQLLLPLYDKAGNAFPKALFDTVRSELTDAFGGVTLYVRSPAMGVWQDGEGDVARDDVVLVEVMTPTLDVAWWASYRSALEHRFQQDRILVRASAVELL